VKQARHYLHPYREDRRAIVQDAAAFVGLRFPFLRPRRRVPGSVWACSMVRDEVDIIDLTLDHLLRQGVQHVLVADNGSTDGTLERLRERARTDERVHVAVDREGRFFQGAKMTRLAQVAAMAGADWVVPVDADELWFAPDGTLAEHLARTEADQITADMFNAVPRSGGGFLLDAQPTGWKKVAFRAHPLARVEFGNHAVGRVGRRDHGLHIAHVAYRSAEHLRRKLVQGAAAVDTSGIADETCYHWRWGADLDEATLDDVWSNVAAGRPDPRIDWQGLTDPREAAIQTWREWPAGSFRRQPDPV
jgi:glycosyl transferase family 2